MADYFATEDDYARMVQAVGPKLAKQYMEADQKRGGMNIVPAEVEFKPIAGGLGVGGSDVNENDMLGTGALDTVAGNTAADDDLYLGALPGADTETDNEANLGALPGGLPPELLSSIRAKTSKYEDIGQQQRDFYARVEEQLRAQRMGPSFSERMFELSAALAKPTTVRGFSGVLNNVMPVLQQQAKEQRTAEMQRRDALNALTAQQLAGQRELIKQELGTDLALARIAKQGVGAGLTYDATRGIYVDKNNPRPTENTYTIPGTKRILVQWQDGLWREELPSGGYKVFERAGNDFKELSPKGAR